MAPFATTLRVRSEPEYSASASGQRKSDAPEVGVLKQAHPTLAVKSGELRWRVLLDNQITPVERVSQVSITPLADSPVSLEELFVVLGGR